MIKKAMTYSLICLMLVNSIAGCYTYKEFQLNERDEIEKGQKVKIFTTSDEVYNLTHVIVRNSGIIGAFRDKKGRSKIILLSKDEIRSIEIKKDNYYLTLFTMGLIGGLIYWGFERRAFDLNLHYFHGFK